MKLGDGDNLSQSNMVTSSWCRLFDSQEETLSLSKLDLAEDIELLCESNGSGILRILRNKDEISTILPV